MRLVLLAALCLACASKHPPRPETTKEGMRLAKGHIAERLRSCARLPKGARGEIVKKGARQISEGPEEGEAFEMELMYEGRDYYVRVGRTGKKSWAIQGDVKPDPCGDDVLAITEDMVDAINAQDLPWKAAMPPAMTGKTLRELGAVLAPEAVEAPAPAPPARRALLGGVALPESYDARDRRTGEYPCEAFKVRDQGSCGTCTHFAAAAMLAGRLCTQQGRGSGTNVALSPRQTSDCVLLVSGCSGGGNAKGNLQWYTATPPRAKEEWCLPYQTTAGTCGAGGCQSSRAFQAKEVRLLSSTGAMQGELLLNGPIVASFMVEPSFRTYSTGVYVVPPGVTSFLVGHSVMVVGWGTDNGVPYWLAQNSWGPTWGDRGMFRIRRGYNEAFFESREVVTATAVRPLECPTSPCANGALTLPNCSCVCTNPAMGGARCDTPVGACQNGGRWNQWNTSCLCTSGTSGPLCQHGFLMNPVDTASCQGAGRSIVVPYTTPTRLDPGSRYGLYTLTENGAYYHLAYARVCPGPDACPLSGSVTLQVPTTLPPARYRIMLAVPNAYGGLTAFDATVPVMGYHTVLPAAACTPEAQQLARTANSPAVPISEALAAETAALALMSPRLDAATGPWAQLFAQGTPSITVDGLPLDGSRLLLGSVKRLCFFVPLWKNAEKKNKQFQLRIPNTNTYYPLFAAEFPPINFVATPAAVSPNTACFSAAFPTNTPISPGVYALAMATDDEEDYATTGTFSVSQLILTFATPSIGPSTYTIIVVWELRNGVVHTGDTLRLASKKGTNAAPSCALGNTRLTATSVHPGGRCAMVVPLVSPTQSPYIASFFPANSSSAVFTSTLSLPVAFWTSRGL
jgi:hypothetical protein